ncbi:MAG: hypothetical protein HOF15_13055, partial [Planctomycetaceae bacterium]|nr:hypothetical protein [Planctomycetaceae bacterium]
LISSQIKLGAAFGDAFSKQIFLGQAIILDAYDRAYRVDLRNRISSSSADLAVTSFLEQDQTKMVSATMPEGLTLGFDVKERDEVEPRREVAPFSYRASLEKARQDDIGTIRFSADLGHQSEFIAGLDASPLNLFTNSIPEEASGGVFFNSSWTSSPQLTLLGNGDSFKISHEIGSNTKFDIGMHHSSGFSSSSNTGAGHLLQMQLSHKSSSGFRYGLTTGYVSEEESLFSSSSRGAFGTMDDNRNEYATLAASWEINDKTIIFGTYTNATLKPSFSGDSLFDNWSRIHANSFAIGLTTQSQFTNGDRLGISVGQPLRVSKSTVDATLPVGRDLDGNVLQETQRVDLVPTGRQIDIQLAYSLRSRGQTEVTSFAALSLQPGHDSSANPEAAVGFKWRLEF